MSPHPLGAYDDERRDEVVAERVRRLRWAMFSPDELVPLENALIDHAAGGPIEDLLTEVREELAERARQDR